MTRTLDPKLDVVFKLLFGAEKNRDILLALLNDVLAPERPIVDVTVLNPEIDKQSVADRGLVLDLHCRHSDGSRTDVEMQCRNHGGLEQRTLYHWARMYGGQINRGDAFADLSPCRVIFFLSFTLFPDHERLHSTFRVLEVHDHWELSTDLELHFVELPKLRCPAVDERDRATVWARFFAEKDPEARRILSMSDPHLKQAQAALDDLSRDEDAQYLAQLREDMRRFDEYQRAKMERETLQRGLERGIEKGLERGIEKGLEQGIEAHRRATIRSLCDAFGVDWTPERAKRVEHGSPTENEALEKHLFAHRAWPEGDGGE